MLSSLGPTLLLLLHTEPCFSIGATVMMLTWILLLSFGLVKSNVLYNIRNETQINGTHVEETDLILENIWELQLQDTPGHNSSINSTMEAGGHLEDALLHIIYLQSAWEQIYAQVDQWELTGNLSRKLSLVSPAQVKHEDASMLLDFILSTVKPFLNNSVELADVGTALNMHNCYVAGVTEGLQRFGPAKLSVNDDLAILSFTITSDKLSVYCDWYQWVIIKYSGTVSATISAVTIEIVIDLKLQPNQNPVVRKTQVKELGDIKSEITGVGPLRYLVRTIINKIIQQYRVLFIQGLEHKAPIAMQWSLDHVKLPNSENIKSIFNNKMQYQQYIKHIQNKTNKIYFDNENNENLMGDMEEYMETIDIKTLMESQNENVNPKFRHVKKVENTNIDITDNKKENKTDRESTKDTNEEIENNILLENENVTL